MSWLWPGLWPGVWLSPPASSWPWLGALPSVSWTSGRPMKFSNWDQRASTEPNSFPTFVYQPRYLIRWACAQGMVRTAITLSRFRLSRLMFWRTCSMPYFCYHIDLYTDKGIVLQLRFLGQVLRVVVQRRWVLMFVCRRPFSLNFLLSSKNRVNKRIKDNIKCTI